MTVIIKDMDVDSISDLFNLCWGRGLETVEEFTDADKEDELIDYLNEVFMDETPSAEEVNEFLGMDIHMTDFYHETLGK